MKLATRSPLPAVELQGRVNAVLASMGWEVTSVEIDLVSERARVEVKGAAGRLVTLEARQGKATLTREQAETRTAVFGRKGDRCPVDRLSYRFLGRHVVGEGLRSGLRGLANYLDDNGSGPRLARGAMRSMLSEVGDAADTLDVALVYQLMDRDRPCCRCAAADHDEQGCRGRWPRCRRSYADHPARAESEAVEAWREAGSPLAMWTRDWCREDPPEDQSRPEPISGTIG